MTARCPYKSNMYNCTWHEKWIFSLSNVKFVEFRSHLHVMFPIAEELLDRGHTGQRKDDNLLSFFYSLICSIFFLIGKKYGLYVFRSYSANEGPVRIQYKCLVPIYVFPEMKLCSLLIPKKELYVRSPNSYTHLSVRDLYISRIGLSISLRPNMWTDPGNI